MTHANKYSCSEGVDKSTVSHYAETMRFRLGCPKAFTFPNESTILFLRSGPRDFTFDLYQYDIPSGKESTLYTAYEILGGADEVLTPEEKARRERLRLAGKGFSSYFLFPCSTKLMIPLSGKVHIVPVDKASDMKPFEVEAAAGGYDFTISPNGKYISFTRDGNLYITTVEAKGTAKLMTPQGVDAKGARLNANISYGTAEFCAQEEMDRFRGHWWNEASDKLVYQKTDQTAVETVFIADPSKPTQRPSQQKYPFAGTRNPVVSFHAVSIETPETVITLDLTCMDSDSFKYEYVNTVTWCNTYALVLIQNRLQTESHLVRYDLSTITAGTAPSKKLVTLSDSAWLNIDSSMPLVIENGKYIVFSSDKTGIPTLSLYSSETGDLVAHITDNGLYYRSFVHYDSIDKVIYVNAGPNSTNNLLFAIPIGNVLNQLAENQWNIKSAPSPVLLTPGRGIHTTAVVSRFPTSTWVVDCFESSCEPFNVNVLKIAKVSIPQGTQDVDLESVPDCFVDDSTAGVIGVECIVPIERVGQIGNKAEFPPTGINFSLVKVDLKDQRSVQGALILPSTGIPKDKKLPLVVYVYGGPGFRVVTSSPRPYAFHQMLADHGFAVLSVDGRGTPLRGREWERAIKNDFITVPMEDQAESVLAMSRGDFSVLYTHFESKKDDFTPLNVTSQIDFDKVGVFGWSFGGYFSAMASMLRPEIYKACVSGAPVSEWTLYDTHYTERFLSFPYVKGVEATASVDSSTEDLEKTEAYIKSSVLSYVDKMNSNLLIIHGTADDNVIFGHATAMSDSLFRAGKDHQFLPLTDFTHMVTDPAVNFSLYSRIIHFLRTSLENKSN